ncbi:hypothetical protein AB6A40_011584 [Gnathostoma spinigerum]|uniref:C2H2-type domain-containing protein n=1 Tax=Gnathostoma spinigerum TaxID=75299 RepID=A0ABD6EY46_9BILA
MVSCSASDAVISSRRSSTLAANNLIVSTRTRNGDNNDRAIATCSTSASCAIGPRGNPRTTSGVKVASESQKSIASSDHCVTDLTKYCYEAFYVRSAEPETASFEREFKCTYGNCYRVLSNNVSLMFHLWAHVTSWSTTAGTDEQGMNEVLRICRCPQCLHIFPTVHRLQVHYTNVHGRKPAKNACVICEVTVEAVCIFSANILISRLQLTAPF